MHRISRMAHVCIVLSLRAAHAANAQNNPKGPAMPAAKQNTFGLASGGGATPRRQAASQAATRAVAVCSDLWDGGRFWLYDGIDGLPAGAYSPSGGQGQHAMIIPSHRVVIVRRGFDPGAGFRIAKFCADVLAAID